MDQILLQNCSLLDGTLPELREDMQVLIEGERIREVSDTHVRSSDATRFDLRGKTLMPGLIDAHVHLTATTLNLSQLSVEPMSLGTARSRLIAESMLQRGFTTVRDAAGADWGLAAAIEYGLIDGPRVFYSGRALSQTGGHGDLRPRIWDAAPCACCVSGGLFAVIADGVPAVQKAAREELRLGASQIKIMGSGGVTSPADPVWNLQFSEEEIRAIVGEATSWRTYAMAHAYTPEAIARCVRNGVRSIEHGNLIDQPTAEFMTREGAFLVPTLVTFEALYRDGPALGLPQVSIDKIDGVRASGLEALEVAKKAGTKIGFGTDLLGDTHHYQSMEFSIRANVLSSFEVIQSATLGNAELLNRSGELGVLAPDALADLIVVDGNPLNDLNLLQEQGKHLALIMKGGQIYKNTLDV